MREAEHIALRRDNPDGSITPVTLPNQRRIKGSTLRKFCSQSGIDRDEFLDAYDRSRYLAIFPNMEFDKHFSDDGGRRIRTP